ncbi:hypothetical protein F4824DRAFT_444772 [Ustulina deusta]|nr:hypothetical protein F4824DRAFT_444772 [Ustulina deusta]
MADLEEARKLLLIALRLYASPISHRITSGRQLLNSSHIFRNVEEAYQIAQTTIQLITPLLAPRALLKIKSDRLNDVYFKIWVFVLTVRV